MRQLGPAVGGHVGVIGDDLGVEGAAPFARHQGADIAHADNADGLLPRLVAQEFRTFDFGAGTDLAIEFAHPPDDAERQGQGHFGDGFLVDAWRPADGDAARLRRREIDIVEADALLGDDAQFLGASHVLGTDSLYADHHAVGVLVPVLGSWIVPADDLGALRGILNTTRIKRIEHIDFHSLASRPRQRQNYFPTRINCLRVRGIPACRGLSMKRAAASWCRPCA